MKRCYLGAGVLAVLLVLGIFSSRWMENRYTRLERQMEVASRREISALLTLAEQTRQDWDRGKKLTAVLADHQYLDRAELAFDQLAQAAERRDMAACARLCLEIAQVFRILAEEQQLRWENLL